MSGNSYIDKDAGSHLVYSADVTLTGGQKLTECSLSVQVWDAGSTDQWRQTVCYVYQTDPTSASSPPSGYLTSVNLGTWVNPGVATITFNFTGLNFSGTKLYFWIYHTVSGNADVVSNGASTISGSFSLPSMSINLSSLRVTTGEKQVVTITNGSGYTVTVSVKYGNTNLYSAATTTGTLEIPVTMNWFTITGLTTVSEFSVSVTIDLDATLYESFTVVAGDDMKPGIRDVIPTIVQTGNAATYFPSTYLANVSKCKVQAEVSRKAGATIQSVEVTYTGRTSAVSMTYNSSTGYYEATIGPLTEDTTMRITVTDSRGLTGTQELSQEVVPYSKPAVNISASGTYRCDSSGSEERGGAYWRALATATYYTSLTGNSLLQFKATISTGEYVDLSSGVQSAVQGGALNATSNYTLIFTIQDKVSDPITKSFVLESVTRNVVFRRNSAGTTVGIGTTPTRAEGSAVEVPAAGDFLMGGIPAQAFKLPHSSDLTGASFEKDFLNVNTSNTRAAENAAALFQVAAGDSTWSNVPSSHAGTYWYGYRAVLVMNASFYAVVIVEFLPYVGRIWINVHNSSSGWTGWKYHPATSLS